MITKKECNGWKELFPNSLNYTVQRLCSDIIEKELRVFKKLKKVPEDQFALKIYCQIEPVICAYIAGLQETDKNCD